MKLSEIIIRRKIRRILQEAVPVSTATQGTYGYAANPRGAATGGKATFSQKLGAAVLGAIGLRVLYGIIKGGDSPSRKGKMEMNAVICGDSQGRGPLGVEVGKILGSKGYKVTNTSVDGAGPDAVLAQVKSSADNAILVVAIFGGNTTSAQAPANAVVKMYEECEKSGTAFMAIGPPPVTKITQDEMVQKYGKGDADYWLNLPAGDMHSPTGRNLISDAMEKAKSTSGEDINVYGVASNWTAGQGGNYPDQPDGFHCMEGADNVAQAAMNALRIDAVTAQLKEETGNQGGSLDEIGRVGKPDEVNEGNFNIDSFKKGISASEGNYSSVNPTTKALGKYQIVPSYHWNDIVAFAKAKGKELGPSISTSTRAGRKDYDAFLKDTQLQEDYMDHFVKDIVIVKQKAGSNYNDSRDTEKNTAKLDYAQIAAITHFGGGRAPGDVDDLGINTVPRDNKGNPTPGNLTFAEYLKRFNKGYYGS
jgi:hypothetical protein